jgi:hypothetical protein
MDQNEASQRRELRYRAVDGTLITTKGDSVYSVTPIGVVIAVMNTRILIPWHNITDFTYHTQDVAARKVIQGY